MTEEQLLKEIENSGSPEKGSQVEMVRELISRYSEELLLSEKQQNELERKLSAYQDRPVQQEAWSEVKARLRSKP